MGWAHLKPLKGTLHGLLSIYLKSTLRRLQTYSITENKIFTEQKENVELNS
jgi:hypothetical protein